MTSDTQQQVYWEREHDFRGYQHPVVEFFARQRINCVMANWLDLEQVDSALDVGCGDGFSTFYVSQRIPEISAVDRSTHMLDRHPLRHTRRLYQADARQLPFEDNHFDLVYGWEILHHIADPCDVLREMMRVSRRYVLVAEPNRNNPAQFAFALADSEHRWVLRYSLAFMRRIFERAGLSVLQARTGGWIFPNKTPRLLLPVLRRLPYFWPLGITNWVLGRKDTLVKNNSPEAP
ncbi:MAG: methyltransferase domain-containing protein [Planctomycetota bacterium]